MSETVQKSLGISKSGARGHHPNSRKGIQKQERDLRRKIYPKNSTPNKKSSSEQVFLNNFRLAPDSCPREEGKSSRELFKKVRVEAVFLLGISGFGVGFWASRSRV